ncbi:MAG: hypothetical protein QXQ39_02985 [Conexivisphaerales archaeon]
MNLRLVKRAQRRNKSLLKTVRKIEENLKERLPIAMQFAEAMHMEQTKLHIGRLYQKSDIGKKMVKAGIALIAIPDPVTDIPGAAMAVSGAMINRYKSSIAITDLKRELRSMLANLQAL